MRQREHELLAAHLHLHRHVTALSVHGDRRAHRGDQLALRRDRNARRGVPHLLRNRLLGQVEVDDELLGRTRGTQLPEQLGAVRDRLDEHVGVDLSVGVGDVVAVARGQSLGVSRRGHEHVAHRHALRQGAREPHVGRRVRRREARAVERERQVHRPLAAVVVGRPQRQRRVEERRRRVAVAGEHHRAVVEEAHDVARTDQVVEVGRGRSLQRGSEDVTQQCERRGVSEPHEGRLRLRPLLAQLRRGEALCPLAIAPLLRRDGVDDLLPALLGLERQEAPCEVRPGKRRPRVRATILALVRRESRDRGAKGQRDDQHTDQRSALPCAGGRLEDARKRTREYAEEHRRTLSAVGPRCRFNASQGLWTLPCRAATYKHRRTRVKVQ